MKPREKVVTAEDITSSLYFVHVEHPEDVNLLTCPDFQDSNYSELRPGPVNRVPAPLIHRKAVPNAPAAASARKPVPGTLSPIANFDNRQNASAGRHAQRPAMLTPAYEPRGSYDSSQSQTENDIPSVHPRRPDVSLNPTGISLTLIRRDPASGAQWNVARIDDPTITGISSNGLSERKPGSPLYIEISNPGYSKFLHSDADNRPPLPTRTSDLSCRHVIPGLQGAPPAAATVSELRFNLPSANKAPSPIEGTSKRSSFFKRGRHSRNNSSISVNQDDGVEDARKSLDRMDLTLGQEFAGGGFGGKQAKLGKIILEDEGLKMMDLLVATNIGLWWRAYEKAQAAARNDRGIV
ncbi:hypothetical protein E8E12_009431 [Didymella heteroderae]|uniref:Uncharacterized protein n=1 Tax=Didymella heteroderae TaxID=1769908 RepID=A0A9P5C4J7_9PLEO|nr:hypothetical protein E8E12_009431 [Didymella heteroderae]